MKDLTPEQRIKLLRLQVKNLQKTIFLQREALSCMASISKVKLPELPELCYGYDDERFLESPSGRRIKMKDLTPEQRIAKHKADMPNQYHRVYDIAMTGRSLRAAVNSQCIECVGYVFKEVRQCCDPECPLYPYRPVQGISYGASEPVESEQESTNGVSLDDWDDGLKIESEE